MAACLFLSETSKAKRPRGDPSLNNQPPLRERRVSEGGVAGGCSARNHRGRGRGSVGLLLRDDGSVGCVHAGGSSVQLEHLLDVLGGSYAFDNFDDQHDELDRVDPDDRDDDDHL